MQTSVSLRLDMTADTPTGQASSEGVEEAALSDPSQWVDDHGDYLFSYAMFRLRDPASAQDAVQETFLAALRNRRTFAGKSSERGWLLGILGMKGRRRTSGLLVNGSDLIPVLVARVSTTHVTTINASTPDVTWSRFTDNADAMLAFNRQLFRYRSGG